MNYRENRDPEKSFRLGARVQILPALTRWPIIHGRVVERNGEEVVVEDSKGERYTLNYDSSLLWHDHLTRTTAVSP